MFRGCAYVMLSLQGEDGVWHLISGDSSRFWGWGLISLSFSIHSVFVVVVAVVIFKNYIIYFNENAELLKAVNGCKIISSQNMEYPDIRHSYSFVRI